MAWLAKQGFDVVGVELSPIACEQFFAERHIVPTRIPEKSFIRWNGGGVTILEGDFFRLEGRYPAVLDRGGLVSFPQKERQRYAQHLKSCLGKNAVLLLVTVEYDQNLRTGPPFPVSPDEVRRLFPGAKEISRRPFSQPRWRSIGGADAVVWKTSD